MKTLDEHNDIVKRLNHDKYLTDIECPNCGDELKFVSDLVYLTSPGQRDVKCYSCNFSTRILV